MTVSHAFVAAIEEERSTAQAQFLRATTDNDRSTAIARLLAKPIAASHALCIPPAQWGHPMCGPTSVQGFVAAKPDWKDFPGLGWAR